MCLCQTAHPHGIDTCQQKSIAGRWVVASTGRQPSRPSLHRRRPTWQVAIPCRSFFTIIPNSGYQDRLCNSRRCGFLPHVPVCATSIDSESNAIDVGSSGSCGLETAPTIGLRRAANSLLRGEQKRYFSPPRLQIR